MEIVCRGWYIFLLEPIKLDHLKWKLQSLEAFLNLEYTSFHFILCVKILSNWKRDQIMILHQYILPSTGFQILMLELINLHTIPNFFLYNKTKYLIYISIQTLCYETWKRAQVHPVSIDHPWDVSTASLEFTCVKFNWLDMIWKGTHLSI